jgi:hypothetical protein
MFHVLEVERSGEHIWMARYSLRGWLNYKKSRREKSLALWLNKNGWRVTGASHCFNRSS